MAMFCQIIAGMFCLQTAFPVNPEISLRAFNNGLGGGIHIQGNGWAIEQISTDVLNRFNRNEPDAKRACVQNVCVDFRRSCTEVGGKISCRYDIDTGLLSTFSLNADSREAMQRAVTGIALYRGDKRESDFPLALLDSVAEKP